MKNFKDFEAASCLIPEFSVVPLFAFQNVLCSFVLHPELFINTRIWNFLLVNVNYLLIYFSICEYHVHRFANRADPSKHININSDVINKMKLFCHSKVDDFTCFKVGLNTMQFIFFSMMPWGRAPLFSPTWHTILLYFMQLIKREKGDKR